MRLQESGEMYLETILILSQRMENVRAIDIGEEMGYSKPSVSRALKILKENSYINVDKNGYITLSKTGQEIAEKMIKSEYIMKDENGKYLLNDMVVKLDLMNFKIEQ